MIKVEDIKVGKCYADDYTAVRVDSINGDEIDGVRIYYGSTDFSYIATNTCLDDEFSIYSKNKEITKERFLEILEKTKENFIANYNRILEK